MGIFDRLLGGGHGRSHGGGHGIGHGGGHGSSHDDRYRNDPPRPQDNAWGASQGMRSPAAAVSTIACAACGAANGLAARFCQQCGISLVPVKCTGCDAEVVVGMKFCGECGKER